ncbi:unnamed protein product, partial [Prorocentrum cordatum]
MFNDEKLKDRALMFRDWGRIGNNSEDMSERFGHSVDGIDYDFKFLYGCVGYNMKACEMNAAFGLAQLEKLDRFRAMRARNINRYVENLRARDRTAWTARARPTSSGSPRPGSASAARTPSRRRRWVTNPCQSAVGPRDPNDLAQAAASGSLAPSRLYHDRKGILQYLESNGVQ